MDVSKINNNLVDNTISSTKNKLEDGDFERRLKNAYDKKDEKELKKACDEFEEIFLNMMYKQMRATVPKSDLIPDDSGKEIFEQMLDEKLVEEASSRRSLGLSDILYRQLSRQLKNSYEPTKGGETEFADEK